ncbi:MAG: hypothetical protein H7039_02445, partial [Bryobacteraceae bacterium]|nr:hypothetical protein [Bryobacteraceae bacterium]
KRFQTGNRVADYLIGSWQTNAIVRLSSGQPYSLQINGDLANTGNAGTYLRLDFTGNPEIDNPTTGQWFDTSKVAAPAPFTFGNSGRNRLRSDGWENFDLSVFRVFKLPGEGRGLEFRAEAFNAFNHPVYSPPNANFSNRTVFGRVTGIANQPRQVQFGLKLSF